MVILIAALSLLPWFEGEEDGRIGVYEISLPKGWLRRFFFIIG